MIRKFFKRISFWLICHFTRSGKKTYFIYRFNDKFIFENRELIRFENASYPVESSLVEIIRKSRYREYRNKDNPFRVREKHPRRFIES